MQQIHQQTNQKKQQIDINNGALYSQGLVDQGYGPRKFSKIDKKTNVSDMISPHEYNSTEESHRKNITTHTHQSFTKEQEQALFCHINTSPRLPGLGQKEREYANNSQFTMASNQHNGHHVLIQQVEYPHQHVEKLAPHTHQVNKGLKSQPVYVPEKERAASQKGYRVPQTVITNTQSES